jgi:hypothetical protein
MLKIKVVVINELLTLWALHFFFLFTLITLRNSLNFDSGFMYGKGNIGHIKVKVKLSLCFSTEHHARKAYWGVKV